jgi:glycosyltransferase involved in cell wall biosynthesis
MKKVRILAVAPDSHGVGKYRILDPFKFIGDNYSDEFHIDITFNVTEGDDFFKNYDIVVFHSFIHQNTHEQNIERIQFLKSQGIKVVMDIDDYWSPDFRHPMYLAIKESQLPKKKLELMKISDYVTCTTDFFANSIKTKTGNKNVFVFPNAIDSNETQFQPKPTESNRVRFGWLGGSSHLHDIELLNDGISIISTNYDNVQFVLCGFDLRGNVTEFNQQTGEKRTRPIKPEETVWFKYEKVFTNNYRSVDNEYKSYLMNFIQSPEVDSSNKKYRRVWTQPINTYGNNYNLFDVSLAPVLESDFNANKSQLKVIESGFHKKPIIASETAPYTFDLKNAYKDGNFVKEGNALTVPQKKGHKLWAKYMKLLIENPNMIEDLGNKLYETVKDNYSLQKVCKDRTEFFKSII